MALSALNALDIVYAKNSGAATCSFQPDNGEQARWDCRYARPRSAVDVVVIDSVAALVPKAEIEGEMGDPAHRSSGRLMSQSAAQADRQHQQRTTRSSSSSTRSHENRRDVRHPRERRRAATRSSSTLRSGLISVASAHSNKGKSRRQPHTASRSSKTSSRRHSVKSSST